MDESGSSKSRPALRSSTHQSIYELIRQHDRSASAAQGDIDDERDIQAAVDEQNLRQPFHDQDLDRLLAEEADDSQTLPTTSSRPHASSVAQVDPSQILNLPAPPSAHDPEPDIPTSLLAESHDNSTERSRHAFASAARGSLPAPVPGPTGTRAHVQWDVSGRHHPHGSGGSMNRATASGKRGPVIADPVERAMWKWANVDNLDNFLAQVYAYFRGRGIWSIILARAFGHLTVAFLVGFGVFLGACVDYKSIPNKTSLAEITIPQCTRNMSGLSNLALWVISFVWIYRLVHLVLDTRRLWQMHCFFVYLLKVSEDELQTITWQAIVSRLMDLRDLNARTALNVTQRNRRFIGGYSKQRMDAHDIANRLMRKENYLIALFNKEILDLTLPIPFLRHRPLFSRNLEWNIELCVINYVFNEDGQVSELFLNDFHRQDLIEGLRRRFFAYGCFNVLSAPFLVAYFLWDFFLRYFTEFQNHPSKLGSRSYTPLAEWKFREFNELYHFFERRLNMSRPFASQYLDQFPKDKTAQVGRFVAFVAGALAAVLAIATLLDPELFLGFEITKDRTALFYISLFGSVWAVARGLVPEEESVFDPEYAINKVADYTHYKPDHWEGRLHAEDVRQEFSSFYQMKIVIFLEEVASIVLTPFILWFALPNCSERLVDFFREFTIHVDGLGHVCSFALFEFQKGTPRLAGGTSRPTTGDRDKLREDYYSTKDGKMLSSYYSFLDSYANNPRVGLGNAMTQRDRGHTRPQAGSAVSHSTEAASRNPGVRPAASRDPLAQSARARRPERSAMVAASPSPSLLLDARHQPLRPVTSRADPRALNGSFLRRTPIHEDPGFDDTRDAGISSSALIDEDSNLGDSWKTTMATGSGSGRGGRTQEQDTHETNDAGVLGLLYEFQKAQTEGRGAVV